MRIRVGSKRNVLAVMCLLACVGAATMAQEQIEAELSAEQRILPAIGPGLRAIRQGADGRLYVLASPTPGLLVFNSAGKQLLAIGEFSPSTVGVNASPAFINFGDDCDVDADGKIYVADRGANVIRVFSADGALLRSIAVKNPVSVAALQEGEVAGATLRGTHLGIVFSKKSK